MSTRFWPTDLAKVAPRNNRVIPGTSTQRYLDATIHLTSFVPLLVTVPLIGRPHLGLGALLFLGPVVLGAPLAAGRYAGLEHRARAIDLAVTVGASLLVVYLMLSAGVRFSSLALLLPLGVILLLLLVLNWVLFAGLSAHRARYGELFEPPWVLPLPAWLRGAPRHEAVDKKT